MGNKYSCMAARDDTPRINVVTSPPPVSRITLKSHRSHRSLVKSFSSHDTLYEKDHSRHDSDPFPHVFSTPFPPPSVTAPPSLLHPSLSAYIFQGQLRSLGEQAAIAYSAFLQTYPEYQNTWIIDTLRRTDLARLDRAGEAYVDYMGGAQHSESLVRVHSEFLTQNIMGNTHSVSNRQGRIFFVSI